MFYIHGVGLVLQGTCTDCGKPDVMAAPELQLLLGYTDVDICHKYTFMQEDYRFLLVFFAKSNGKQEQSFTCLAALFNLLLSCVSLKCYFRKILLDLV